MSRGLFLVLLLMGSAMTVFAQADRQAEIEEARKGCIPPGWLRE